MVRFGHRSFRATLERHIFKLAMASSCFSWRERALLAALAFLGLAVSLYLAANQVGMITSPWDPVFGPMSSLRVLHSSLSRALPVPDALLGAFAYALEIVLDLAGGAERSRTHPRLVLAFAAVAFALGATGVGLVLVQALVVRAGCSLCLVSAVVSVTIAIAVAVSRELPAAVRTVFRTGHHGEA